MLASELYQTYVHSVSYFLKDLIEKNDIPLEKGKESYCSMEHSIIQNSPFYLHLRVLESRRFQKLRGWSLEGSDGGVEGFHVFRGSFVEYY